MVAANLSGQLELADGESGAAAVSVVVGKPADAADPAKPADPDPAKPAGQDKAALNPYNKLKTDDPAVVGKKNTDAADSEPAKLTAAAAAPTLTPAKLAVFAEEDERYKKLQYDSARLMVDENNSYHYGSNGNSVNGNLYSNIAERKHLELDCHKIGFQELVRQRSEKSSSDTATKPEQWVFSDSEAENVVSANGSEQKNANANADNTFPASESKCFCTGKIKMGILTNEKCPHCLENNMASADRQLVSFNTEITESEDLELYLHKTRLEEVLLEKDRLIRQLEDAEEQLKMVKDENKRLCEAKNQQLRRAKKQLKVVKDKNKKLYSENKKLRGIHIGGSADVSTAILDLLAECHNIFVCPHEVDFTKLQDYVSSSKVALLYIAKIPGAKEKEFSRINKMTPLCKVIFLGTIEIVYRLHRVVLTGWQLLVERLLLDPG